MIALAHEKVDPTKDLILFDPKARWKKMRLKKDTFTTRELLVPIFRDGKCIYQSPPVMEIRAYAEREKETLWEEYKRLINPERMPVDLSDDLYNLKHRMLEEYKIEEEV